MKKLIETGLVVFILLIGGWYWQKQAPKKYTVSRVIDGDTMVIDNNQEIRLASVDAPEAGLCGDVEAKNRLKELVEGKKIVIRGTVNDRFGRLLVSVYVDSKLVNEIMAGEGWARYTSQESADREKIKTAAQTARTEKRGVYGKCLEETNKENSECQIKGNNREGKKIYVLPGCKGYTNTDIEKDLGDRWFCSESEATEAGYTKAMNCE